MRLVVVHPLLEMPTMAVLVSRHCYILFFLPNYNLLTKISITTKPATSDVAFSLTSPPPDDDQSRRGQP